MTVVMASVMWTKFEEEGVGGAIKGLWSKSNWWVGLYIEGSTISPLGQTLN